VVEELGGCSDQHLTFFQEKLENFQDFFLGFFILFEAFFINFFEKSSK